jgi:hypothetical protein
MPEDDALALTKRVLRENGLGRGWRLNLDMSGHRLSDFPHEALYKGALAEAPFTPSAGLRMLEIQIRHPERPFRAFFEDLLTAPSDAQSRSGLGLNRA